MLGAEKSAVAKSTVPVLQNLRATLIHSRSILQRLKDEGIDVKFLANWRLNYAMRADVLFSKREVLTDAGPSHFVTSGRS